MTISTTIHLEQTINRLTNLFKMRRKSRTKLTQEEMTPPAAEPAEKKAINRAVVAPIKKDEDNKHLNKVVKSLGRMSNEELEMILATKDSFVMDCLLDQIPKIKKLLNERDDLEVQVRDLANYNYAREPEFVRDRMRLRETVDEVEVLRRRINGKHLIPTLDKLTKIQNKLSSLALEHEEQSEKIAQDFLVGNKSSCAQFVDEYLDLRKSSKKERILVDRLTKDRAKLAENLRSSSNNSYSPVPTPKQRKRISLNK